MESLIDLCTAETESVVFFFAMILNMTLIENLAGWRYDSFWAIQGFENFTSFKTRIPNSKLVASGKITVSDWESPRAPPELNNLIKDSSSV